MMVANRHYFKALRHMLETQANLHLETRAWTRAMIEQTIEEHIALDQVHRLEYRSLNDRVMGLVTSSLKVFELVRPDPDAADDDTDEAEGSDEPEGGSVEGEAAPSDLN